MDPIVFRNTDDLPSALGGRLLVELGGRRPILFLDFDGVIAPIAEHADDARPQSGALEVMAELASRIPVAVVSGRDRLDVRGRIGLDNVYYAGSHGFDISGPGGFRQVRGERFRPELARAGAAMRRAVRDLEGVWVEEKRFAVAVHFRKGPDGSEERVTEEAKRIVAEVSGLRISGGKKIVELRPDIDWHKGRAVMWLIEVLGAAGDSWQPIYIGDDETDEDVFAAFSEGRGLGIVVGEESRPTRADLSLRGPQEVVELLGELSRAI